MSKQFNEFDEELFCLLVKYFGEDWHHTWDAEEGGFYLRLSVYNQKDMWKEEQD